MRSTRGKLYRRGDTWYLYYEHNGQRVRQSLGTTDKKKAEEKQERIMLPFLARSEAHRRQVAAESLRTALEAATAAEAAASLEQRRLRILDAWERFPYRETTRGLKRSLPARAIAENRRNWEQFTAWLQIHHPEAVYLDQVTAADCQEYSAYLVAGSQPLTARRHNIRILVPGVIFRLAGIQPNPWTAVQKRAGQPETKTDLTEDNLRQICAAADGELRRLLAIGIYSGLRLTDAVQLQWSNLRHGRIIKLTGKAKREVAFPLHPALQAVLDEVPLEQRSGFLCPGLAAKRTEQVGREISALFTQAGIQVRELTADGRRRRANRAGFHALRHAFASICARAGVPIGIVQDWLGHSSPTVTRIYQHYRPEEDYRRVMDALPTGLLTPAPEDPEPERADLARLAQTAPIAAVRLALTAGRTAISTHA
jgi:integrase